MVGEVLEIDSHNVDRIVSVKVPRETPRGLSNKDEACLRLYWRGREIDLMPRAICEASRIYAGWDVTLGEIVYVRYTLQ